MPKVLDDILASFFIKLSEADAMDADTIAEVKAVFQSGKKLKADDVSAVISRGVRKRLP